uniref:Uncharacterized protein n=1 Tax=Anguilla anguilla TaxID=7936 RepID=A0A0E9SFY2_ANGAN
MACLSFFLDFTHGGKCVYYTFVFLYFWAFFKVSHF